MCPKALHVPKLVLHKPSGKSVVFLRGPDGRRAMVYCGPHGSTEAQRRYREVLAEHLAGRAVATKQKPAAPPSAWPTVEQLVAAYLLHAQRHYVGPDGRATGEVTSATYAFQELLRLHRDTPTDRFQVNDLHMVRQAMIDDHRAGERGRPAPKGLCRRTINGRMHRVKRLFRWGTERKLVPGATWHELSAFTGLPQERGGVHDNPAVEAVPWALVEETLPHLVPTLRDAVIVQWWTGMRPGEMLTMTRRQIDTSGAMWLYRPVKHKGSWRGRDRIVAIGPKAQAALRPRLRLELDAAIFSPRDAWEEFRTAKRAARKTPPTKQMEARDARSEAAEPKAEFFDVDGYRRHIERACDRAGVPRWSPHRLRHAAGTRFAIEEGIEAARAALGHADLATTRRYAAGADAEIAKRTAAKHG